MVVYCLTAAAQTAVLTAIVVIGKGAPTPPARRAGWQTPSSSFT